MVKLNICLFYNLLQKYNKIWDKVSNIILDSFDSRPVYKEKCLKTKIKSCGGKVNTVFHNDKIPKEGFYCICLSVILIDFLFKIGNNYHLQLFLVEFKFIAKENKSLKNLLLIM